MVISVNEQDAIARGDAEERDETDDGRNADDSARHLQGKDPSHQRQGQVDQHDGTLPHAAELVMKQQEDDQHAEETDQQERACCRLFALELTAILQVVTLRQCHSLCDALLDVAHHAAQVASLHVARDDNLALRILTVHGIGTRSRGYLGNVLQGNLLPVGINHEPADVLYAPAVLVVHLDGEVEGHVALIDLRHRLPLEQHTHVVGKLFRRDTVAGHELTARCDAYLRTLHLLLHIEVGHALHVRYLGLDLVGQTVHAVQVLSEELDGDIGLRTRQHGIDAVRDGLPYLDAHSGQFRQLAAHLGHQFPATASLKHERSLYLTRIHAEGMLVQFRTSRLAGHRLDFRDGHEQFLGTTAYLVTLLQRDAGQRGDAYRIGALVETGQEGTAHAAQQGQGHHHEHCHRSQDRTPVLQGTSQQRGVCTLQGCHPAHVLTGSRFLNSLSIPLPFQEIGTEHRGERESHHRGGKERHDEGYAQRHEHTSLHALQEEERQEAHHDDERGVEDGHTHLARSIIDDTELALQPSCPPTFQAAEDILHIHDGIVHQRAYGYGHASDGHGVDGKSHEPEGQYAHQQRDGDADERDERGAGIHQEEEEHDDDKQSPLKERLAYVADGGIDEAFLTEYLGIHLDFLGQTASYVLQGGIQPLRKFLGGDVGLLGHGEEYGRLCVVGSRSHLGCLVPHLDVGKLIQRDRRALHDLHHRLPQGFDIVGGQCSAYQVLVAILIEHASRHVLVHVAHGSDGFLDTHPMVFHPLRVKRHLILLFLTALHRDLCHAADAEQARTQGPVCQGTHLLRVAARQSDDHHFTQDGRLRAQGGLSHRLGQGGRHLSQFLVHYLAVPIDIRTPVELYPYARETRRAAAPHAPHMRGTVHGRLDGDGHDAFHLLGCHAAGLGHHHHGGCIEVGKDIHLHVQGRVGSPYADEQRTYQDGQAVA